MNEPPADPQVSILTSVRVELIGPDGESIAVASEELLTSATDANLLGAAQAAVAGGEFLLRRCVSVAAEEAGYTVERR